MFTTTLSLAKHFLEFSFHSAFAILSFWALSSRLPFLCRHHGLNFNQSMLDTKWSQGSLSFSHLTGVTSWMFAETFGDASRNLQHLSCSRLLSSTRNGFKSIADPWAFTVCRSKVNLVVTMGLFRHHHWSGITCRLASLWARWSIACPKLAWALVSGSTVLSIFQCRLARHFEARRLFAILSTSTFEIHNFPILIIFKIFKIKNSGNPWFSNSAFEHFYFQNPEFLLSKSRISTFKIQNLLNSQFVLIIFSIRSDFDWHLSGIWFWALLLSKSSKSRILEIQNSWNPEFAQFSIRTEHF